jgi:oligopeptide/dipeptide ABC transporter ATP-binding protein
MPRPVLLEVKHLSKHYPLRRGIFFPSLIGYVKAVDDVSFDIFEGETFGLVGESGSGKTTVGRLVLNLVSPTNGELRFQGKDILKLPVSEMKMMRQHMQIIFQKPFASLNPRKTVRSILENSLKIFSIGTALERAKRVSELLDLVGLNPDHLNRYPHEFSGGQRQRIGIARALAMNPKFVVLDEPVSALDVSVQAQILNLLKDLQAEFNLTYLFIANNLNVVGHLSHRVGVLYMGRIIETAPFDQLFSNPRHPHTKLLLKSVLTLKSRFENMEDLSFGERPDPLKLPRGCAYAGRCPRTEKECRDMRPDLIDCGGGHFVACHFADTGISGARAPEGIKGDVSVLGSSPS